LTNTVRNAIRKLEDLRKEREELHLPPRYRSPGFGQLIVFLGLLSTGTSKVLMGVLTR
jgi:hypothetical protein